MKSTIAIAAMVFTLLIGGTAEAQIGKRFPSEKKVVKDPVTGTMLTFLTSTPTGDSKIYQTHNQWTSDGQWLIFRSGRVRGEAMAVNENTGEMVQVTEGGYTGMLSIARYSMKLYFMRNPNRPAVPPTAPAPGATPAPRPATAFFITDHRSRSGTAVCGQQIGQFEISGLLPEGHGYDPGRDPGGRRYGS